MISERITPDNIIELKDNEVFLFGSNLSGRHGKGAAKTAMKWGAKYGQAYGLQGRTFAIPTMNASISQKLTTEEIKYYVDEFIEFAKVWSNYKFLVTEIGCGLAKGSVKDVAPLFEKCIDMSNVYMPRKFWEVLKDSKNDSRTDS